LALILLGVVGGGILIFGLWKMIYVEDIKVEVVKGEEQGSELKEAVVDIAGAVEKPGLYKLPAESRIGDALVVAQGLAANADREWVAKNINLAEIIKDGGKVYIPRQSEKAESQVDGKGVITAGKININTASISELDTLSGIGEVRAKAIFDNRPYTQIEELMSKAKIPASVYEKIKDSVTLY
jgi:competence protein ComEA